MVHGDLNNMNDKENKTQDISVETFTEEELKNRRELTVFEEIRKADVVVADPEKLKVPMSMVFGHGTTGNLPSFGNRSLNENTQLVDTALQEMGQLEDIWNHSHTQWTWKHINLSYHSPMKNMRQISAEISGKKSALRDAKWRHIKNEAKIRKYEEELLSGKLDYWREVDLKIKLAELKEGMVEGMKYIEGAMKDVLALQDMYNDLKKKVNNFNEHDVEKEETKSHMKRSIVQCIRDVRQSGHISKGEQEYVEQIGINPTKLQKVIRSYVKSEEEAEGWGTSNLMGFVDQLVTELADVYKVDVERMELMGFDPNPVEDISMLNRLAHYGDSEETPKEDE